MNKSAIIIHGGCNSFENSDSIEVLHQQKQEKALAQIIEKGWDYVIAGKKAMDIAEKVTILLENSPYFNAGRGSALNERKKVELDASIMDGDTLSCGAVSGITAYKNPVSIARNVISKTNCVYLSGIGAEELAQTVGFTKVPSSYFVTDYQLHWWDIIRKSESERKKKMKGTVGVVVLDTYGSIAAATSTGGLTFKMKGRIGDSPLIGSGTYADSRYGGVSLTGYGEQIIKTALAKHTIDLIRFKKVDAQTAAEQSIRELSRLENGKAGIICIDAKGNIGRFVNEKFLNHAYMSSSMAKPIVSFKTERLAK
jgi:beta-aspartyl-peptidase (threonine type)